MLCKGVDNIKTNNREMHPGIGYWEALGGRNKRWELLPELSQGIGIA